MIKQYAIYFIESPSRSFLSRWLQISGWRKARAKKEPEHFVLAVLRFIAARNSEGKEQELKRPSSADLVLAASCVSGTRKRRREKKGTSIGTYKEKSFYRLKRPSERVSASVQRSSGVRDKI